MADIFAAFQAVLAIPGALESLKNLASRSNHIENQFNDEIKKIEDALLSFTYSGKWFIEAKDYHEKLTVLDLGMRELVDAASSPRIEGGFNVDRFDMQKIVVDWSKISKSFIRPILGFFQYADFFSDKKLERDGNKVIDGPVCAITLINIQLKLDELVVNYDARDYQIKCEICDTIDELENHVKDEIFRADKIIIDRATEMAEFLSLLKLRLEQPS